MVSSLSEFLTVLREEGLEGVGAYYGPYEALVGDNKDPEKRGRIRVTVPNIAPNEDDLLEGWFTPAAFMAGTSDDAKYGWFWPPEIGDVVQVTFYYGSTLNTGSYFGGRYVSQDRVPAPLGYKEGEGETEPVTRGVVTRAGHQLVFFEEGGKEEVDLVWKQGDATASLKFLPNGSVEVTNKQGSKITLDAENKQIVVDDVDNGNTVTLDSNGVKVKTKAKVVVEGATEFSVEASSIKLGASSASFSAVLGEKLAAWLKSHTHPTGVGPSGTPVPPLIDADILSQNVKVKS